MYEIKIEAFVMWTYRRMLRISWVEQKYLEVQLEVLKITYLGHIMRGSKYEILYLIIQKKTVSKRSIGRW